MSQDTSLPPYLQLLSYSALNLLHECPRKFQLSRLNAWKEENTGDESLTFAFGHCVGRGVQAVFEGYPEQQVIFLLFCLWPIDFEVENPKQEKSFYHAILAVRNFYHLYHDGTLFKEYELAYIGNVPAVEYSFNLLFPKEVKYRGAMDIVLRHKETAQLVIVEVKTTSYNQIDPAQYANSNQAISYSTVLGHAIPNLVSYTIYYLVYYTHAKSFEAFPFVKNIVQQTRWIQDLLLDIRLITMYHEEKRFPLNGNSCINKYGKKCQFFNSCQLNLPILRHAEEQADKMKEEQSKEYNIVIDVRKFLEPGPKLAIQQEEIL